MAWKRRSWILYIYWNVKIENSGSLLVSITRLSRESRLVISLRNGSPPFIFQGFWLFSAGPPESISSCLPPPVLWDPLLMPRVFSSSISKILFFELMRHIFPHVPPTWKVIFFIFFFTYFLPRGSRPPAKFSSQWPVLSGYSYDTLMIMIKSRKLKRKERKKKLDRVGISLRPTQNKILPN